MEEEDQLYDMVHHFHKLFGVFPEVEKFKEWHKMWKTYFLTEDQEDLYHLSLWKGLEYIVENHVTFVKYKILQWWSMGLINDTEEFFEDYKLILELDRKTYEGRATPEEIQAKQKLEEKQLTMMKI